MEAGVLVDKDGRPIYWHEPPGASPAHLPDSRALWDAIWERRDAVEGFAHSHPGRGRPRPSQTDLTTFAAIEAALGRRLRWWIASEDAAVVVKWYEVRYWGAVSGGYWGEVLLDAPAWLTELRRRSYGQKSLER